MERAEIVLIIGSLIVVALFAAFVFYVVRPHIRSRKLRGEFGPEYGRTVDRHGDRARAEDDLRKRKERVANLRLRSLDEAERTRYVMQWERIQERFVDEPSLSIREANRLVADVMAARGYPVTDFDTQVNDLSVNYPALAENYRSAHAVYLRNELGSAGTEELRQAVVFYRGVFSELLEEEPFRKTA